MTAAEGRAWDGGSGTGERARWLAGVLGDAIEASGARGPVLELCGGTGLLAAELTGPGRVVWMVEPDLVLARQALAQPAATVVAVPECLPWRAGRFAMVVGATPRAYVDPLPVLSEAQRVLRPGGRHLVAIPDPDAAVEDPIGRILAPMRERLRAGPSTSVLPGIVAAADRLGLACDVRRLPPRGYRQSPAREAADLRRRASSVVWGVSDAVWAEVVEPAIGALLGLPDPDRPVERRARYVLVTVGSRPRGG